MNFFVRRSLFISILTIWCVFWKFFFQFSSFCILCSVLKFERLFEFIDGNNNNKSMFIWINVWNDCLLKHLSLYFNNFFFSLCLCTHKYVCLSVCFSLSISIFYFSLSFPIFISCFKNTVTKPTHLELDNGQVQSHSTNGKNDFCLNKSIINFILSNIPN